MELILTDLSWSAIKGIYALGKGLYKSAKVSRAASVHPALYYYYC